MKTKLNKYRWRRLINEKPKDGEKVVFYDCQSFSDFQSTGEYKGISKTVAMVHPDDKNKLYDFRIVGTSVIWTVDERFCQWSKMRKPPGEKCQL